MQIIAHRGQSGLFPENTLVAFRAAADLGVDMVECDVHVSRDGELVVIHDPTLTRTGRAPLKVSDLTVEELAQCDVGGGAGVPTLSALLEDIHIPVAVEIKTARAVRGLVQLLTARPDLINRVVPISFFHAAIKMLVDQVPGLEGGVLLVGAPIHLAALAHDAHVRLLSLHHQMVDRELVEAMHEQKITVSVWTPNTPEEIETMIQAGVDAIASDRPDLVLKAVGRS